jgi:hypothetical protein
MTTFAALGDSITLGIGDRGPGLPAALARPLARRIHTVNAVMDDVADRFGTLVFDAAGDPETYDRRMWSVDRMTLGPRPEAEPTSAPPTRRAQAGWMATKGTGWVIKRSTDLVPYLVFMGLRELWGTPTPAYAPEPRGDDGVGRPAGTGVAG